MTKCEKRALKRLADLIGSEETDIAQSDLVSAYIQLSKHLNEPKSEDIIQNRLTALEESINSLKIAQGFRRIGS